MLNKHTKTKPKPETNTHLVRTAHVRVHIELSHTAQQF